MRNKLVPQCLYNAIEHQKHPARFEALRRVIVRRLALIALLAGLKFKRHNGRATAFACALAIFFVGHKEFEGTQ